MSAYTELLEELQPGEMVEALVFGAWGWAGYGEPNPPPVPCAHRGKVLTLAEAEPYMQSWGFVGGHGAPDCYALHIWTNQRVLWVTQYDGSTSLSAMPRHPRECMPYMPGGG